MQRYDLSRIYEWPLMLRLPFIFFICAAVFYGAYFFDFASLKKKLHAAEQEEVELKQQIEAIISNESLLRGDLAAFPEFNNLFMGWQKQLVTHAQWPELLNEILKIGAANNIHFSNFSPGEAAYEGDYINVPLKVVVHGSYRQIAEFISQVANMSWIVVINHFLIGRETTQSAAAVQSAEQVEQMLQGEFVFQIYQFNENVKHAPQTKTKTK